ncbi:MAG: efflux transporter outer membrane subunit, partial [Rubrivivax sp.]
MTTMTSMPKLLLTPLLAALVLAGCASTPAVPPQAELATPATFKEGDGRWTVAAPAEAQPRGEWWKAFADPVLDELVEKAAASNTSIQTAAARLAQAQALLRSADAQRRPQLGVGAGVDRQHAPAIGTELATVTQVGANLSYELDLFGRLARASNAASLDAQAREALLQSTRLLVQAEVAQSYLSLRALDAERALVRDTVTAYQGTLRLTERRQDVGDVAELDVVRVRTEVASTESDAFELDRRRASVEHALAVLVGEAASSFTVPVREWQTALPVVPAGVPGTVLARRPDVSAAQASLLAAQSRVGVAQAAWFPSLTLTGAAGHASPELGDLFRWSARAWSVGALLSLPIFDGGRREAGVQSANAELQVAQAAYREQILVAFKEVEDQLSALRLLSDQS